MMKFTLPLPPPLNQTYGVWGSKMYKNKIATEWEEEAGYKVLIQKNGAKPFKNNVQIGIEWFYKHNRDIDAGLKILLDLLQKQQIYENDRQVRYITHININKDLENPRVEVTVDEMD